MIYFSVFRLAKAKKVLRKCVYPRFFTRRCHHQARQLQVQHLWPMKEAVGSNEIRTRVGKRVLSPLNHRVREKTMTSRLPLYTLQRLIANKCFYAVLSALYNG